jgi:hypothetical protein
VTAVVFGSQQSDSERLSAFDVKPAGHAVHCNDPLAAYVFGAHVVHAAEPVTFLTLPAAQKTHGPPFGPVLPALHTQLLRFMLPTDEFELTGHTVHDAVFALSLYVPIPQAMHGPKFGPV